MWYLIIEMTVYQDKLKVGVLSRKYFVFSEDIDLEMVVSILWFRSLSHGSREGTAPYASSAVRKYGGLRGRAGARRRVRVARV